MNTGFLLLLLAVPIVLGFLIRASAGGPGLRGPGAETALLLLVIVAAFTGGFSSEQELIENGRRAAGSGQPACPPAPTCAPRSRCSSSSPCFGN